MRYARLMAELHSYSSPNGRSLTKLAAPIVVAANGWELDSLTGPSGVAVCGWTRIALVN